MVKYELTNRNTVLERAGQWYLRSGIQEPNGGVARYYHSDVGRNARVSTEITGYAVSFLVYLYQETGSSEYLDAALRAARFLTRHAWSAELGVFPFEHSTNGSQPKALAYFFDSGIIVRGLLSIWRATKDQEFLDIAVATGQGMIAHFHGAESIHPILALPGRQALAYEPRWSASPGCYQLKSSLALFDLFEETGAQAFLDAYEDSLSLALANGAGFLPGEANREKVMDRLHAFSYFLEAILPYADRPECAQTLCTGIDRVAHFIDVISPEFARSDVYAQLLRVRLWAADLGVVPLNGRAAEREAQAAEQFQFASADSRFDGGFGFGIKHGEMMPFVNPVSTAFCAQAIAMWHQHQAGEPITDRKALV